MKTRIWVSFGLIGLIYLFAIVDAASPSPGLETSAQMRCTLKKINNNIRVWKWVPGRWTVLNGKKVFIPGRCVRIQ